eukprot:GFYU01009810.1.p1 GENE.GFYU01009810.1~~GFYU01009810.1.p1  ORF type:complete len:219 (-),score=30.98 GFYU01009810.1:43-699(-)
MTPRIIHTLWIAAVILVSGPWQTQGDSDTSSPHVHAGHSHPVHRHSTGTLGQVSTDGYCDGYTACPEGQWCRPLPPLLVSPGGKPAMCTPYSQEFEECGSDDRDESDEMRCDRYLACVRGQCRRPCNPANDKTSKYHCADDQYCGHVYHCGRTYCANFGTCGWDVDCENADHIWKDQLDTSGPLCDGEAHCSSLGNCVWQCDLSSVTGADASESTSVV